MVAGITIMVLAVLVFVLAYESYKKGIDVAFVWLLIIGATMVMAGASKIDEILEATSAEKKS